MNHAICAERSESDCCAVVAECYVQHFSRDLIMNVFFRGMAKKGYTLYPLRSRKFTEANIFCAGFTLIHL